MDSRNFRGMFCSSEILLTDIGCSSLFFAMKTSALIAYFTFFDSTIVSILLTIHNVFKITMILSVFHGELFIIWSSNINGFIVLKNDQLLKL